jgi:hypothetical protein
MPDPRWQRLRTRCALRASAARLFLFVALVSGASLPSCAAPPPRPRAFAWLDASLDSQSRANGPAWRADHYPALNLHGPFERPQLADTSIDPNDALSYLRLGDSVKQSLPGLADRAYYWALRLDPTMADAYFARWSLLRRRFPYRALPDGSIKRIDDIDKYAVIAIDSLLLSAISQNPFTHGGFEAPPWILQVDPRRAARDPVMAGMRAYATGDFRKAVSEWAKALRKKPQAVMLRIPRAFAWVRLDERDSAIAELTALADRIETVQQDSLVGRYYSRDFLFYSIGMLHAKSGRVSAAREAYEKALVENLGMYMAHFRLSAAATLTNDTTLALTELEMAKLIRADDPWVLLYNGSLLRSVGRLDDAERELRAALRADSDFALPHLILGLVADSRLDTAMARAEYTHYLTRASRTARERDYALDRLAMLKKGSPP